MRSLIAVAAVLSSLWPAGDSLAAEDDPPAVKLAAYLEAVRTDEDATTAMDRWRTIFGRSLQMHIDRLAADFSLDSTRRRHLEVAAKGTVERFMRRWIRSLVMRAILQEESGEDSELFESILDADDLNEMQLLIGADQYLTPVTNDRLWQNAVSKVLGPERSNELQKQKRARSEQFLDRSTDNVIEWFDRQYFFSKAQRKTLRELVRLELSKQPVPAEGNVYSQFFTLAWAYRIPEDKLLPILTESQMTIWVQVKEQHLEILNEISLEMSQYLNWFNPDSLTPEQLAKFETK